MSYRVIKGDDVVGSHARVVVGAAGELACREDAFSMPTSIYAPGQWDHVCWEDEG